MNEIIKILMERDGMTEKEAKEAYEETKEHIFEAIESGDFYEAEDIMLDDLGLEMDYIFDMLF